MNLSTIERRLGKLESQGPMHRQIIILIDEFPDQDEPIATVYDSPGVRLILVPDDIELPTT